MLSAINVTLSAVLSTALDAAIAMREDGSIAAWNAVAEQTFGWSLVEVRGRQLSEVIIPPELRLAHDIGLQRYLKTGVAHALGKHIEVVAMDRSERRLPAELSTTELDHEGERIFVGFIRDISARKEAENRIKEVTERLELAVRAHSIGVFDTDPDTGEVHWNEELERIYGYAPGSFGTTLAAWRRHVLPRDLARITAAFKRAIKAKAPEIYYSYRMTRCDGEVRFIEASARLFYDSTGKHVRRVGVNIDVTDREITERRLSEAQAELIHLSRLNALGAMASSLGHELNQPLTAVANYISAARRVLQRHEAIEAETALEALDLALASNARAGELIKRLRLLSSKGEVKQCQVSLSELVEETASLALHDADFERIQLELVIGPGAKTAHADPVLLQQVFFNLLRNAIQAMNECGGTITVRASVSSVNEVLIEVQDTGSGLDQEVAKNLFTAFVSTKSDGMGVGLSICRTIIEKSGGRIWATSNQPGTSFFFTLPRHPASDIDARADCGA